MNIYSRFDSAGKKIKKLKYVNDTKNTEKRIQRIQSIQDIKNTVDTEDIEDTEDTDKVLGGRGDEKREKGGGQHASAFKTTLFDAKKTI